MWKLDAHERERPGLYAMRRNHHKLCRNVSRRWWYRLDFGLGLP